MKVHVLVKKKKKMKFSLQKKKKKGGGRKFKMQWSFAAIRGGRAVRTMPPQYFDCLQN